MMFDWNGQAQAGDSIWGELSENEDHIVPYPKGTEEDTLFTFGDYNKKQRNREAISVLRRTEQTTGAKNDFPAHDLENSSTLNTNEELSAPRLDIDTWPDLPALSAAFNNGYTDQDSMATDIVNDFHQEPNLSKERVQLNGEPELFSNVHEYKGNDNFLDCDWANIGDFDFDRIFRNEPGFGHGMASNGDEFPSPCTDGISNTAQSIPMPDLPLNRDQSSDQGCSFFQFEERSDGNTKSEKKTADSSVRTRDQTICQTHLSSEGTNNQFTEKEDKLKKLSRNWKRAEENNKNKSSLNLHGEWSHDINHSQQSLNPNFHPYFTLPPFQSPTISQQGQVGDVEPMGHLGSHNQPLVFGCGYSTFHFPALPLVPHIHAGRNQLKPVAAGHKFQPDPIKNSNYSARVPDVLSRSLTMTPQEKIEKLRRRQQMQAMLAIQQQQNKFDHQMTDTNKLISQACSQRSQSQDAVTSNVGVEGSSNKFQSSNMTMQVDHDEFQISPLIDDHYLEENIYYELQDALGKLDATIRLIIRDSLFRLARSAAERQSASDRNSTNKSSRDEDKTPANEATDIQNRFTGVPYAETDTNPVDRMMAHLLFYRPPSDQCAR